MEKLPEAVILRIFSELGFEDLRSVARVNKQCNRIAFDPFLWKFVKMRGHFLGHEGFIHFFKRICDSLVCCDLKNCSGLSRDLIIKIVKGCPRLKILSLKGCQVDKKDMEEDTIYLPLGMKILDLRLHNDDASLIFRGLLPRMYTMEVLAMDHFHLPSFPVHRLFRSLRSLRVLYCSTLLDDDLYDIATNCPFLETLSFAGCTCVVGKFLPLLVHFCPRLRTLLLSGTSISNEYLLQTNWAGSGIIELDISYSYSITEEGLLSLLPRLPRLTYLQGSFCGWGRSLSDDVIQKMAERNCTRLETLDIHSSYNLSEHALYGLLSNCANLTTLCVGSVFNSEEKLEATLRCLSNLKTLFITKQSAIRTEVLLNSIVKYCLEIEALALHSFYAISRSKVEVSLLNVMNKCQKFKTLCIRGTKIPLRTEMIAIAGAAKKICGRRDIEIVRSAHNLSVKPRYGLDHTIHAEFKRYRNTWKMDA